jgi:hypothetical protein
MEPITGEERLREAEFDALRIKITEEDPGYFDRLANRIAETEGISQSTQEGSPQSRRYWIWGAISIWGRVIPHSYEVRAEHAGIELLALHPSSEPSGCVPDLVCKKIHFELCHVATQLGFRLTNFDKLAELSTLSGKTIPSTLRRH